MAPVNNDSACKNIPPVHTLWSGLNEVVYHGGYINHRLRTEWHKSPKRVGHLAVKMKLPSIAAAFFTTSLVINAKGRPSGYVASAFHNAT